MKKLFRKIIFHFYEKFMDSTHIINMYIRVAKKNLVIKEKIINVKKGKRRYTLLVIKTAKNKTIFNLQRH
jgi:hypothetical protein